MNIKPTVNNPKGLYRYIYWRGASSINHESSDLSVSGHFYWTYYNLSQRLRRKQHKLLNTSSHLPIKHLQLWLFCTEIRRNCISKSDFIYPAVSKTKIRNQIGLIKVFFGWRWSFLENNLNSNCVSNIIFKLKGAINQIQVSVLTTDLFRPSLILRTVNK